MDHQKFPSDIQSDDEVMEPLRVLVEPEISSMPHNIQRQSKTDEDVAQVLTQYHANPLRCTQKGTVHPQPKMKKQLKAKRKRLIRIGKQKNEFNESVCIANIV